MKWVKVTLQFILCSLSLREKCPNKEFFLGRIRENTDERKLRIWTIFTKCFMKWLITKKFFFRKCSLKIIKTLATNHSLHIISFKTGLGKFCGRQSYLVNSWILRPIFFTEECYSCKHFSKYELVNLFMKVKKFP